MRRIEELAVRIEHAPTKMVLALTMILIVVTMAFASVALAHGGGHDGDDQPQGHSHEPASSGPSAAGKQQASRSAEASHSDGGPSPWLPVGFTLASFVVLGGIVVVLRRS